MSTILELNNIKKAYDVKMAVDIDKLVIEEGDCVGLVGESGCGKSTLAGIITNTVKLYSGSVIFKGEDISRFNARKMRDIYKNMQMIYQSPVASFDPEYTLGKSVAEALRNNKSDNLVSELFISVGLSAEYVNKYPGQVSGGECQRAAIARALAVKPEFLICDEATSALDPRITHGILELLKQINEELGITIVVVTHQMEVVKQICQRVAFLKHGVVLAEGKPEELFVKPTEDVKKFLGEEGQVLPKAGVNVQLFFTDDSSDEPVITEMARELGIDFSICWAKLEEFRENVFGSLILNIQEKDKERVFQFLESKNVTWEVL